MYFTPRAATVAFVPQNDWTFILYIILRKILYIDIVYIHK